MTPPAHVPRETMSPVSTLDADLQQDLAALDALALRRRLRAVDTRQGATVRIDHLEAINFSSNNYLGLATHPALVAAARESLACEGVGAGAARLIVGNLPSHRRLEQRLAAFHDAEAALLFPSGYQANVGVLSALAGPEDVILSDALNHASLIDGCRLSRARICVYRHRDTSHVSELLATTPGRRRFVVTDTIFSMDGDLAPLVELRRLADRHGAHLVVDEAHATGVLGRDGRGLTDAAGVRADVHIATLGKALGVAGAYVVGSRTLIDFLLHRARSFVFTTGTPPSLAAAACAALDICLSAEGATLRDALRTRTARFRDGLASIGLLAEGAGMTPIFPIGFGDERQAMAASEALLARGVFAQAIRPPTVPPGTARLRFALMATHSPHHLDQALDALSGIR
jgi:8-amino-7-oxononanoate synthase